MFAAHKVALWYRRRFNLPVGDKTRTETVPQRYYINFEAVDYEAAVRACC